MITDLEIEEGLKLCSEATEGPWRCDESLDILAGKNIIVCCVNTVRDDSEITASFIATARTLLPKALEGVEYLRSFTDKLNKQNADLLAENEKLRTEIEQVQATRLVEAKDADEAIYKLTAENERLRTFINPKLLDENLTGKWVLSTELDKLRTENEKLLRVKEAAHAFISIVTDRIDDVFYERDLRRMREALKALDEEGK